MKKTILLIIAIAFTLKACGQIDQTFTKPVYFNAGFYLGGVLYNTIPSASVADWNTMINKPVTFPPSVHNHDLLYKSISYVPTYAEITGKPAEIELIIAIPSLAYLPLPSKTTTEINVLVAPAGSLVWDKTLGVLKVYNGIIWKLVTMTN
jgi:hypothetical protein